MDKLLTIIVPTYNRREALARGLEALLPQIEEHSDDVALYVSDNCSDDGTEELVRELQSKHPGLIQYKRQSENIGAPRNYVDAVEHVHSKYICLFGDDDTVMPNYVAFIIEMVNRYNDVALFNYNVLSVSPSGQYYGVNDVQSNYGRVKFYDRGAEFIIEHTYVPGLMSSNVIDRDCFVSTMRNVNFSDYPGYGWFATLLKSIVNKPCIYIDQPLVIQNVPSDWRWSKKAPSYFINGLSRLFLELDSCYPGIREAWGKEFSERPFFQKRCLELLAQYKEEYQKDYPSLKRYSISDEFAKQMKYYLFYPSWYCHIIFEVLPRLNRRLRRMFHV